MLHAGILDVVYVSSLTMCHKAEIYPLAREAHLIFRNSAFFSSTHKTLSEKIS